MAKTLYHYCSIETFCNIVAHQKVRLSALSLSNDSMEGRWTQKKFAEVSAQKWKGTTLQLIVEESELLPDLYGAFGLCLSSDGDKLSQWRGYADDGYGVSIGFNAEVLTGFSKDGALFPHKCVLKKVIYDEKRQEDLLGNVITALQDMFQIFVRDFRTSTRLGDSRATPGWRDVDRNQFSEPLREMAVQKMGQRLPPILYTLKNPAFKEESEWRLVSTYPTGKEMDYPTLGFHPRRSTISPYVSLSFAGCPDLIESVTLGPKNITPVSVLKAVLHSIAPHAEIKRSSATYRGT